MKKNKNVVHRIYVFLILLLFLISTVGCISEGKVAETPSEQENSESNTTEGKATETPDATPKATPKATLDAAKNVVKKETKKENKVIEAETKTIDKYLYFNADIFYEKSKELYFELKNCKLKGLYVKKDEKVEKGQLLAELDTSDLEYQIMEKQIELEKLYLQYDTILNKAGTETADNSTALELLELDIESIDINIAHIEDLISRAKLIAPYTGIVTDVREAEPGTMVRAYDKLMTIWNTKGIILESEILNPYGSSVEMDLSNIYTGKKVELIFGGIHNQTYIPATITKIVSTDNGIQDNPNRILSAPTPFKVVIKPDGKDAEKLSVDRTVVFRINNGTYDNAVVLPKTAIIGSGNDTMIKVMKGDKIINRRVVTSYIDRESNDVVISSGLLAGEKVLVNR